MFVDGLDTQTGDDEDYQADWDKIEEFTDFQLLEDDEDGRDEPTYVDYFI